MYYTQTKLYYDIIFWPIGILRGNDVTIVLALNRISALIDLQFRHALRCAYFGCLFSVMRSFTDICERAGVRGILEFLMKRYKLCTNWRLELMQTNLLPFGCFRKSFIAHSTQLGQQESGAHNVTFRKIPVRKTFWDLEFSEHLL